MVSGRIAYSKRDGKSFPTGEIDDYDPKKMWKL
jgi:hypothetical protein